MAPRAAWPLVYQIRVRGQLGKTMCSAFPALRTHAEDGDTVLTGVLTDPAALYGVLAEAEALGLELIEVRRLPPGGEGGLLLADEGGDDDGVEGAGRGVVDVPADHDVAG